MTLEMLLEQLENALMAMTDAQRIGASNQIKTLLHRHSPFNNEPVDCVLWVPADEIQANDYNPNVVAPPEKRLLYTSLLRSGFTQPLIVWQDDALRYTLVDGYHRFTLARRRKLLRERLGLYIPIAILNQDGQEKTQRIATTIRHNRARGQHQIQAMSAIVQELVRLGWDDKKIAEELGMEADEVIRLKQISGLMEMFLDRDFSEAWTV